MLRRSADFMRLLTLNGGGTAGYATCLLLEKIEHEFSLPISQLFDLVHGVSTGAIIAGAISMNMSASDLVDLYRKDIPLIFKKVHWPFWRWYVGPPKYNADVLEGLLRDIFGFRTIGEAKVATMIHALQVSPKVKPFFWKSWREEYQHAQLADIIRASSAAPTYFTPKTIMLDSHDESVFMDGGLCANNPSHCTLAEAMRLGVPLDDIMMVNIQLGDGAAFTKDKAESMCSLASCATSLPEIMLGGNLEISEYISEYILGDKYFNLDFNFPEPLDFWSDDYAKKMEASVNIYWASNKAKIVNALMTCKTGSPAAYAETVKLTRTKNDSTEGSHGSNPADPRPNL